jgi:hypothetical protein
MEDDEYIPIEPNYYNYNAKNKLLMYFSNDVTSFNKVYLFSYKVNNKCKKPFLNILLNKKKESEILNLPDISILKNFDISELINYSKIHLFSLFMLNDLNNFIEKIIFNGFYIFDNNLYLFFDITECQINVNDIYSNNSTWFAIIDEILNYKKLCNLLIHDDVSNLFLFNSCLCFLTDENNENYEIPVVCYIDVPQNKVNFKYFFGESCQDKNSLFGPYYYFTDFENVFKNKENECIVRFALFMGNVKYIENSLNDHIDESNIKKQRLEDSNLNQNMERLTMRISDHDGLWSKSYDSVYLGYTELDNGECLKNTPLFVIKEYEQQVPLSYHYKNKAKLDKYCIL